MVNRRKGIALMLAWLVIAAGCTKSSDLSGEWKGKITLAQTGSTLPDLAFTLRQDREAVTGRMVFTRIGADLPLEGSCKNGKLSLRSPVKNGLSIAIDGDASTRSIKGVALLNYSSAKIGKKQDRTTIELAR
ncbi:hypothetical protein L4X63_04870 [Geomonas sp. Red32]|uniref:hypothetical protein n=1 Tax=Geomonas sp. Red32 TaxID=2912856 RepID=UPI00202CE57D|nr:hypothetical protein [Geomonas sp. Red32]MCM0080916.1 hypothetical protein [Geomonas sp. Red32]